MTLFWLYIFISALFGIAHAYSAWQVSNLRRSGVYPHKGKATIADVARLRNAGLNSMSIRCYREIYKVSLKEAKAAVLNIMD